MKWRLVSIVLFAIVLTAELAVHDPYAVLGIPKTATLAEVKNAYRNLVKIWHPDKSTHPEAETKFIEITTAYEALMNKDKPDDYATPVNSYASNFHQFFDFDMDNFFENVHQRYNFDFFRKLQIHLDEFNSLLLTRKSKKLTLILFYSEYSLAFLKAQSVLKKVIEDLAPIGVDFKTMNKDVEPSAFWRAKGVFIPHLISIMDSNLNVYQESFQSVDNVINFVRKSLPVKLIPEFNDFNIDRFLSTWSTDNRVRALIMQPGSPLKLRYALIALEYRNHISFGFVNFGLYECRSTRDRYKIPHDKDTLLILKENIRYPAAHLSMTYIPMVGLRDIIESNKYLTLPRLSSQEVFDTLCPVGEKNFCLVLVSHNSPNHEAHRQSIRRFAQEARSIYPDVPLAFMYVFRERQPHFINSLIQGTESPSEPLLHIVLLTRLNKKMVSYKWLLGDNYNNWANYDLTKERLTGVLNALLGSETAWTLSNEAHIGAVLDEHGQSLIARIATRAQQHVITMFYTMIDLVINHGLFFIYIVFLMIGIMMVTYFLYTLVETEIMEINKKVDQTKTKPSQTVRQRELKLHELRAETYNGLVRLIKPGCRTIILLIDNSTAVLLARQFYHVVWPYRKNKSLMFGYLNLDRGPSRDWYCKLLSLSLADTNKSIHINTRNCVGTVLSLCSLKKYFCMYHAKHPESSRHVSCFFFIIFFFTFI
uniref:DnaJ subfamily C member 16 n=1 Tax=Sipha flava TaxID=143950 RepID=A0A2S2QAW4_9HEMI